MIPKVFYLDDSNKKKLKACIKKYYAEISKDERIRQEYFNGNSQWEFFYPYYKEHAEQDCTDVSKSIFNQFHEIKNTISWGEIHYFLEHVIFYRLTFNTIGLLILTGEKQEGKTVTATFEPRQVSIKSALSDEKEMDSLLALFDQQIAEMVSAYKKHKSLAIIETANLRIDDIDFEWCFCNTHFVVQKSEKNKELVKWVSDKEQSSGINSDFKTVAVIKFEGSSSQRAFAHSMEYFNKVFGSLRLLFLATSVNPLWTSKDRLEIPDKQPAYISSHDPMMWSGINPNIDNDFHNARKENSIAVPILNKEAVEAIESSNFTPFVTGLLNRAFTGESKEIDDKIFDAVSWFSEAQKNTNSLHKVVAYITALETLLSSSKLETGSSDKSISELISDRGAIILYDDYENRLSTKKQLKTIYGLRSAIVHGNKRRVADSEEEESKAISEIEKIVSLTILNTMKLVEEKNIKSIPELNTYIQKVLLT